MIFFRYLESEAYWSLEPCHSRDVRSSCLDKGPFMICFWGTDEVFSWGSGFLTQSLRRERLQALQRSWDRIMDCHGRYRESDKIN